ncbi:MAG: ImmA/IrrE family metallo-endopeptidase [Spiribacter salinus]|uniref:ImmA/IrrE family metallo-endopeptidase n=1 Tax=Spiribacter salinus TaxID=1335746 RepID=A0A540VM04_9GAMM|nr:MAG: ImmA/IrrE family metallo-endopeptidase [Spiribacter salinus]
MLGTRIKQAREAAGLNQRELAAACGVSAMAISKYERGLLVPSSKVLMRLAEALGVRVEYFFRTQQVALDKLEFRKHARLPAKQEKRVLADALEQMERWLALEDVLPNEWSWSFRVPKGVPAAIESGEDIERAASAVRKAWGLGTEPIVDLIEVLEEHGLKVLLSEYAQASDFDGLAAEANGHTVVLVGANMPGDRQRFTIAHELGHLVLAGRLKGELAKDEERACHRFAGAFLVPAEEVRKALGKSRSWIEPRELYLLKQQWGLSMGGWSYRASDLGIINRSTLGRFWGLMRKHGWKEREPDPQYPPESPQRFERLIYRALAEELIGESRAAELLGIPASELARKRNLEADYGVDHQ